jgi:hypothetical protein
MSDGAFEADEAATPDAASKRQSSPLWIDELPFISMLVLALGGAAYASLSPGPSLTFWQILAPVFAVFCIAAGWRRAKTKSARWRIVWTQALHWSAILLAMRLLFLPRVEQVLDRDAFRLAIIAVMSFGDLSSRGSCGIVATLLCGAADGRRRADDRIPPASDLGDHRRRRDRGGRLRRSDLV